ncbi:MAG: EAL domain-containing protein [Beijerinckiaceae bacterium]|nr:EAL domain-containing protein [Beijerinckiaceae bacterium]MDO9441988.1 EAL domain-containing protein [Beijerinckiaceae bacterium]
MAGHPLLSRQVAKATGVDGALDLDTLMHLVAAAYAEKDLDRTRADRASQLVSEELEDALAALETQNLRFKAAMDHMSQGLCLFDRKGRVAIANRRFAEIYQLQASACAPDSTLKDILLRSPVFANCETLDRRLLIEEHEELNSTAGDSIDQVWPDGRTISIVRRAVDDGGFLDTVSDITESRLASARIAHLARHDALTDLPNRVLLRERLQDAVRCAHRGESSSVLCLDLDRFKGVNDTLGHPVGDALLVAVTKRLLAVVREHDTVARLGGDEFAIILYRVSSPAEPSMLARRIIDELSRPYRINGHQIQIGASIGIEMIGPDTADPDEALRNADLALYKAKGDGRGEYKMFEPKLHAVASRRMQMENDLHEALGKGQFEVHYQPQIDVRRSKVHGFEALVRWRHPERGLVQPSEFIALSEEMGLIDILGRHVLETACKDATTWPKDINIAVNLSAIQFKTNRIVSLVDRALRVAGLEPERLELEITESVMLDNGAHVIAQLNQLKRIGVRISLDDFGTGYSSLSYIRNFPFDNIKIDKSFVQEIGVSADSLAIIRAVTGLCSSLGISTTAEGVETEDQMRILTDEKLDTVQGFLFGKAGPLSETYALFHANAGTRAA